MIILCAWCEREGRPALLYNKGDDSSLAWDVHSHGICKEHRDRLLSELHLCFTGGMLASAACAIQEPSRTESSTASFPLAAIHS